MKTASLDREMVNLMKDITNSEVRIKSQQKQISRVKKVTDKLSKKIVQLGGEGMLQKLLEEVSVENQSD